MNRRNFARLSALTLAATRLPAFAQPPAQAAAPAATQAVPTGEPLAPGVKPIGYAAIGLGTISDIFIRACAQSKSAKITALVTGHPETKGKRYAAMCGIPETSIYTYEQYDKLRENKDIDAVYVGLPNSMHKEYTIRAAQMGKHVLCEKPMAISSAQCREMIAACKAANVKLMIAYRVHYEPTHVEAKRLVDTGAIGEIQAFEGSFGFNAQPNVWRLDPKMAGGGSLLDVGIYPLNETRWMTGEEPVAFSAFPTTRDHTSGRFAMVEQTLDFSVKYPSGIVATFACSYGSSMPGFLRIHGTQGTLEIAPAYDYSGVRLRSLQSRTRVDTATKGDGVYHFLLEAEYFANCVRNNITPATGGEEGLRDLQVMEAIYKAAGTPMA